MSLLSHCLCVCLLLVPQGPAKTIRQHYEAAEAKRAAGDLSAAEAEYGAILGEAYDHLGSIYSAEKRYPQAIKTLELAIHYQQDSPELLVRLAIAYFEAGQYERALAPLDGAIKLNPNSVGAHHMLGKTYFMRGEFAKSRDELQTALKLAPGDYDLIYTLGLAYLKERQFDSAKRIYERLFADLGQRPQLHVLVGRAYRETGFLAEAIDEFKKAVALDPKFPRAHYYLGLTYLLKDGTPRVGDAEVEFKLEVNANPDEFLANYFLGLVYLVQREWEPAINFLE